MAEGVARALRDELLAVRRDLAQAALDAESSDRTERLDAQIELPALERDAARLAAKLDDARAAAASALAVVQRTRQEADDAVLRVALLEQAAGDPQGSLIGKQSEAWERDFQERGWLPVMHRVQRGEDVQQYDMLRMMGVLKDVMIRSGFKEMFVAEGIERARHGPLSPVSVETSQATADAITAAGRGNLTDTRTEGRTGDVASYSPDGPRGG